MEEPPVSLGHIGAALQPGDRIRRPDKSPGFRHRNEVEPSCVEPVRCRGG